MIDIEAVIINGTKDHKQIDLLRKEVARLAKEQGKTPGKYLQNICQIYLQKEMV